MVVHLATAESLDRLFVGLPQADDVLRRDFHLIPIAPILLTKLLQEGHIVAKPIDVQTGGYPAIRV